MADKTVGSLPAAAYILDDDKFVLEQSGEAKSLTGRLLKDYAGMARFTVEGIPGGHRVTVTNKDGAQSVDILDGEPFTYEDFTPEQLEALRGPQGIPGETGQRGEKGEPFHYTDFTQDQLEALRGPQGIQGIRGIQGEKGDPFLYTDFTPEQLSALTGPKGDKGDPFQYSDFTPEQLAALTGPQGPKGADGAMTFEELTEEQKESLRGPQGIPGERGDPFTYDDFSPEQLEALRGPQGEPGEFVRITEAEIDEILES